MSTEVESILSWPAMAWSIVAASLTSFVIGPPWSRDDAKAIMPYRLTLPYVGLRPTTPHNAAGCLMEPPVSVPMDAMHSDAARDAAEPPLLPPGTRSRSQGFLVTPKNDVSVEEPMANSSILVLPRITAPSFFSFATTVES